MCAHDSVKPPLTKTRVATFESPCGRLGCNHVFKYEGIDPLKEISALVKAHSIECRGGNYTATHADAEWQAPNNLKCFCKMLENDTNGYEHGRLIPKGSYTAPKPPPFRPKLPPTPPTGPKSKRKAAEALTKALQRQSEAVSTTLKTSERRGSAVEQSANIAKPAKLPFHRSTIQKPSGKSTRARVLDATLPSKILPASLKPRGGTAQMNDASKPKSAQPKNSSPAASKPASDSVRARVTDLTKTIVSSTTTIPVMETGAKPPSKPNQPPKRPYTKREDPSLRRATLNLDEYTLGVTSQHVVCRGCRKTVPHYVQGRAGSLPRARGAVLAAAALTLSPTACTRCGRLLTLVSRAARCPYPRILAAHLRSDGGPPTAPAPDCRLSPGSRAPDARSIDRRALALRPPFSSSRSSSPAAAADSLQTRNAYVLSLYPRSLPVPASSCGLDVRCPALQASRSPLHIDIPSHPPPSSSVPSLVIKGRFVRRPSLFLSLSLGTLSARPPFPRRCRLTTPRAPGVTHAALAALHMSSYFTLHRPSLLHPPSLPGLLPAPAPSGFPVVPSLPPSLPTYLINTYYHTRAEPLLLHSTHLGLRSRPCGIECCNSS
ncbi:hypothetical protein B0H14DRAFT_3875114 [Mycena olivaceomarginata]|nr:hypothetical protein B0H14DRAFT_3875114 [Mycena olivaceomarginata]